MKINKDTTMKYGVIVDIELPHCDKILLMGEIMRIYDWSNTHFGRLRASQVLECLCLVAAQNKKSLPVDFTEVYTIYFYSLGSN